MSCATLTSQPAVIPPQQVHTSCHVSNAARSLGGLSVIMGPLEACIAGLAGDAANEVKSWSDHCISPMERYLRQEALLERWLRPLSYAEALFCAIYVLRDDGSAENSSSAVDPGGVHSAKGAYEEIMCPRARKCASTSGSASIMGDPEAKLCEGGEAGATHHLDHSVVCHSSPHAPYFEDSLPESVSEEACRHRCELEHATSCSYYRWRRAGKSPVRTEEHPRNRCWLSGACENRSPNSSSASATARRGSETSFSSGGSCRLVNAASHPANLIAGSSNASSASTLLVVAPPEIQQLQSGRSRHAYGLTRLDGTGKGRRGRPALLLSCSVCHLLRTAFGIPPYVMAHEKEAAAGGAWTSGTSTRLRPTWSSRFGAQWGALQITQHRWSAAHFQKRGDGACILLFASAQRAFHHSAAQCCSSLSACSRVLARSSSDGYVARVPRATRAYFCGCRAGSCTRLHCRRRSSHWHHPWLCMVISYDDYERILTSAA